MKTTHTHLHKHQQALDKFFAFQGEGLWYDKYPPYLSLYSDRLTRRNGAILEALPSSMNRALDIGCGRGDVMLLLAPRCEWVVGTDLAEVMVRRTRENLRMIHNVEVRCAAAESLPFEDCTFDAIVLADVIEHLLDPIACLKECARVLIPGGRLVITTPNGPVEHFWERVDAVLTLPLRTLRKLRRAKVEQPVEPYERFFSPRDLVEKANQSGLLIRELRMIEFYPGSEGAGAFGYVLRVVARWNAPREWVVEPVCRAIFRSIERLDVFNNRQLLVLERQVP